ncbi:acyl-CoA carboxylase subunit epsilon [Rhodococcus sp. 1168]|uniref:acyl-CoA carboxylase subunit epsilon n=1 Tax=Rhodococcus sp. 1168 TaxID=2018041 RepID=UPI000A0B46D6|nr:acyl-CoA carboxylase subunit epsilon [Rhodococcus sp. 1168]ORI18160.1 hypothetical protein BJI47_19505 [Rhodococcus sp. 1168]
MSAPAKESDITEATDLIESAGLEDASAASTILDVIRVVKGNPSDQDIAALVVVLTAAAGSTGSAVDSRPPELWGSHASKHRTFAPYSPYSYGASQRY